MKPKLLRMLLAAIAASAIAAAAGGALLAQDRGMAADGPSSDLTIALSRAGIEYDKPSALQTAPILITEERALAVARTNFGPAGEFIVRLGQLTVNGHHQGDETSPLLISNRLAYSVQLTGLSLPPFGSTVTDDSLHNELVVFVDAVTGEYLLAASVR